MSIITPPHLSHPSANLSDISDDDDRTIAGIVSRETARRSRADEAIMALHRIVERAADEAMLTLRAIALEAETDALTATSEDAAYHIERFRDMAEGDDAWPIMAARDLLASVQEIETEVCGA